MTAFFNDLLFIFQRLSWLSIIDILLVTLIFFAIFYTLRDTKAMVLLRGVLFLVVFIVFLTSVVDLPAFSWLVNTTLPALLLAIPVIFAPEIRRTLERIGRAGVFLPANNRLAEDQIETLVDNLCRAAARLSARQHGALIVLQRLDTLAEYAESGVRLDAELSPELLLQIFYPNTPLHDGAVIIAEARILAASCVMPLSASGILTASPEREMGLRHRAALGISEVSDALALVVSEENGAISVAQNGDILRELEPKTLTAVLRKFYRPNGIARSVSSLERFFHFSKHEAKK